MLRYLVMAPIGSTWGRGSGHRNAKPIQVSPLQRIRASGSIVAHAAGPSISVQDTLVFVARTSVIERIQLTHVVKAYERKMWGDANFRMDSVRGKRELRHTGGTG